MTTATTFTAERAHPRALRVARPLMRHGFPTVHKPGISCTQRLSVVSPLQLSSTGLLPLPCRAKYTDVEEGLLYYYLSSFHTCLCTIILGLLLPLQGQVRGRGGGPEARMGMAAGAPQRLLMSSGVAGACDGCMLACVVGTVACARLRGMQHPRAWVCMGRWLGCGCGSRRAPKGWQAASGAQRATPARMDVPRYGLGCGCGSRRAPQRVLGRVRGGGDMSALWDLVGPI